MRSCNSLTGHRVAATYLFDKFMLGGLVLFGDRFEWGWVRVFSLEASVLFAVGEGFRQLLRSELSKHAPTRPWASEVCFSVPPVVEICVADFAVSVGVRVNLVSLED